MQIRFAFSSNVTMFFRFSNNSRFLNFFYNLSKFDFILPFLGLVVSRTKALTHTTQNYYKGDTSLPSINTRLGPSTETNVEYYCYLTFYTFCHWINLFMSYSTASCISWFISDSCFWYQMQVVCQLSSKWVSRKEILQLGLSHS